MLQCVMYTILVLVEKGSNKEKHKDNNRDT